MTATAGFSPGILLTNLGTPDAPTAPAVRRYLAEFLSDRRVIPLSPLLWKPILYGIILRTRPKRSARLYQSIWTDAGSPLLVHGQRQRHGLEREFTARGQAMRVALGMRYGKPSLAGALEELRDCDPLLVLPLYPQYSRATTASTLDAIQRALRGQSTLAELRIISGYAENPDYIAACTARIRKSWQEVGRSARLILSFHGLPQKFVDQGDPYADQCRSTTRLITRSLGLSDDEWTLTFQSRFGPKQWLTPYTDAVLRALPGQGVRSVDVFCPGFAADCLETLQEICLECRDVFRLAGGETFRYIPALNDEPEHIRALANLVETHSRAS